MDCTLVVSMKPLFHDSPPHAPGELYVDHKTGLIHRPGHAAIQMNGPTTGRAYEEFKKIEAEAAAKMARMRRMMASTYQCTQCKETFLGAFGKMKNITIDGVEVEALFCRKTSCGAPIVMVRDALEMRNPGGRHG
jgi:hypothetical protein